MGRSLIHSYLQSPIATKSFEQQISTCLQTFEQLYEKRQFVEAFEQLYLSLALLEQTQQPALKQHVLKSCVKASVILMAIDGSKQIISSTIAAHSLEDHAENLSMCYFLLSQAMLHEKKHEEAIMHAKMALFYAKKAQDTRLFYECNAKLQLVCTLIEAKKCAEAKEYIHQFNWYLEACQNDVERVFVQSIQVSLQLVEQQEQAAITTMTKLLAQFSQSQEVMYTSYLAMHFKRILQLRPVQLHYAVIKQCDQMIVHFNQLTETISETLKAEYTIHSSYFYHHAYQLVEAHNQQQQGTYLLKFKLHDNLDALLELLAVYKQRDLGHLLYQYARGQFMFLTSADGKMLFHSFLKSEQRATMIHSVLMRHTTDRNFFDLYNELNSSIIGQHFEKSH